MGLSSVHVGDWRLRGEVSVVPAYNQETIDSFFAGIDVLLFPTQAKESFGLTVREALIRDVWVVLTDSGGSVEDIVDGQNGTIIPIGDYVALRDAIRRILREPAQLAGYRNPYRDRIVTFQQQATEVRKLLDQAIAGHTVKEPPEHPACRTKSTIAA
jgi:glycosyltransferase involved in cell wall biosynthesis